MSGITKFFKKACVTCGLQGKPLGNLVSEGCNKSCPYGCIVNLTFNIRKLSAASKGLHCKKSCSLLQGGSISRLIGCSRGLFNFRAKSIKVCLWYDYSGQVTKFLNLRVNSRMPIGVNSGNNLAQTARHVANIHKLGRALNPIAMGKST